MAVTSIDSCSGGRLSVNRSKMIFCDDKTDNIINRVQFAWLGSRVAIVLD